MEVVESTQPMDVSSENPLQENVELNPALESNTELNIIDIQDDNRKGDEGILEGALIKESEEVASDSEDDDVRQFFCFLFFFFIGCNS